MDPELKACQRLYQAVLYQAFKDATSDSLSSRSEGEAMADKRTARAFLLGGEDFATVCEYAGYDPHRIRDRVIEILNNGWKTPKATNHRAASRIRLAA